MGLVFQVCDHLNRSTELRVQQILCGEHRTEHGRWSDNGTVYADPQTFLDFLGVVQTSVEIESNRYAAKLWVLSQTRVDCFAELLDDCLVKRQTSRSLLWGW